MAKANKNLISMEDVSRAEIERLINRANELREERVAKHALPPFILGLLFFQESTRTQIGFQTATYRLGGNVFTLKETRFTEVMSSPECIEDTMRVLNSYADIFCIRHPDSNIFSKLQPYTQKPLINCGNGSYEHPTQALIDLMAIKNIVGRLDNLHISIVGNLRDMRSAHSLLMGLANFKNITVSLVSPRELQIPKQYVEFFEKKNHKNIILRSENMDIKNADVVYVAGFPSKSPPVSAGVRKKYRVGKKILTSLKSKTIILNPLPREDEISRDVDETKFAKYFEQSELGLYMRMAIIQEYL